MSNKKKITQLNPLLNSDVTDNDVLPIVSFVSTAETKKIKVSELDLRWASVSDMTTALSLRMGWIKTEVFFTNLQAAATTKTFNLPTLPAKTHIHACIVKNSVAFNALSNLLIDVGYSGNLDAYLSDYDPTPAVADSNLALNSFNSVPSFSTTFIPQVTAKASVNLSGLTVGSLEVWLLVSTLP